MLDIDLPTAKRSATAVKEVITALNGVSRSEISEIAATEVIRRTFSAHARQRFHVSRGGDESAWRLHARCNKTNRRTSSQRRRQ